MDNMVSIKQIKETIFPISVDEIIREVVKKEDFTIINGKIEPTRNLALKLFSITNVEKYNVELQKVTISSNEVVYACKAKVERMGKIAEGLGACSTSEVDDRSGKRRHHDALAIAETRAFKRALEAVIGLSFINEIILRLFGDYEVKSEKVQEFKFEKHREVQYITPDELINKIKEAKALPHLKNIWKKYSDSIRTYSSEDRERVIFEKEAKKREFLFEDDEIVNID